MSTPERPDRATDRAERALARLGYDTTTLPRVGDGVVRQIGLVEAYGELIAVSMARSQYLGALLAEQVSRAGAGEREAWEMPDLDGDPTGLGGPDTAAGLVGYTYSASVVPDGDGGGRLERVATGEEIRALVKLEAEERDRAAKLIRDALRIGVELHQVEALRTYGSAIAASLQALVRELGLDERTPEINRAAQRAVFAARRTLGTDDGDPDVEVGPPLTADERERALTRR
jgi:hypothetical protein